MDDKAQHAIRTFLLELIIYAALVLAYVLLVLGLLNNWLRDLYTHDRTRFALACLALIIGQGVVLEIVTSALLRFFRSRWRE